MKIDRAIASTNNNPDYYQFWPLFAKRWLSWGITPTLIVISDEKLDIDESLGDVIYIPPASPVPTGNQAQIVRLFAAASYEEEICLISDIDMVSLQREYFSDSVKECDDDSFVVYSSDAYPPGDPAYPAYPMCYLCSKGSNFKEIIDGDLDNFHERVEEWMNYGHGWHTDEKVFYEKFMKWRSRDEKSVLLRRGFNISNHPMSIGRICRSYNCEYNENLLSKGFYIDFHMPRPYSAHKEIIDRVYEETKDKE